MKLKLTLATFLLFACNAWCQDIEQVTGSYIKIDSTSTRYKKDSVWHKDIDTTLLILNGDMSFTYKWPPRFGPYSLSHIVTTGTWELKNGEVLLNSKYQENESRFFESYKPEYGDSLVKVYVQTYDSLTGFFQYQFIAAVKGRKKDSKMIYTDRDYPYNACSATFKMRRVNKIIFYGDFGRMPAIVPKDKRSNHFLLQYNLSTNWDYQYFKNFKVKISGEKMTLTEHLVLIKM